MKQCWGILPTWEGGGVEQRVRMQCGDNVVEGAAVCAGWAFCWSVCCACVLCLCVCVCVFCGPLAVRASTGLSFFAMFQLRLLPQSFHPFISRVVQLNLSCLTLHPTETGEAQIAVVDLLGMLSGIGLCTLVGTSRQTIVAAYVILSLVDISAIYNEIRAVCFSVLNHERTHLLVRDYVTSGSDPNAMVQTPVVPRAASPLEPLASLLPTIAVGEVERAPVPTAGGDGGGVVAGVEAGTPVQQPGREEDVIGNAAAAAVAGAELPPAAPAVGATVNNGGVGVTMTIEEKEEAGKGLLSSPSTVSRRENIFLSSRLTTNVFKTWSQVCVLHACCCVHVYTYSVREFWCGSDRDRARSKSPFVAERAAGRRTCGGARRESVCTNGVSLFYRSHGVLSEWAGLRVATSVLSSPTCDHISSSLYMEPRTMCRLHAALVFS